MRLCVINLRPLSKIALVIFPCLLVIAALLIGYFITFHRMSQASADENPSLNKRILVIDAGHGGEDSGAIGVNGSLEKDINLALAMIIGEELTKKGFAVYYTRTDDRMLYKESENVKGLRKLSDLKTRIEIAEQYDSPLFISIHQNSFGSPQYSGLQVFYGKSKGSNALAESIRQSVKSELQPNNNRVCKEGKGMFLLENCDFPSVIIECGFMSNKEECEKLSEKEYQKQLSLVIVCGIIDYIEKEKG